MILYPPAKINLGLHVLVKRPDGFHEIETCMVPIPFYDILELTLSPAFSFEQTGIKIPGAVGENLCEKAFYLMKSRYEIGNVRIHLRKQIPIGAGLGGGSSDAAHVLLALNELFALKLDIKILCILAAELGSDCPFFVYDSACHATGRGEILQPYACDLSNYKIALVHPGIHVSTAWAFSQLQPHAKEKSIAEIVAQPIEEWKTTLINDFEAPIFLAHPVLEEIKNELYIHGAIYASMSGSGSSLFGIFPNNFKWPNKFMNNQFRVDFI